MKYICYEGVDFHLFTRFRHHREEAMKHSDWEPTSAGFVRITDGGVECYGKSESLGTKADPRDSVRLTAFLRGGSKDEGSLRHE